MNKNSRIYVAGHRGLVGSALCRTLKAQGYPRVITLSHSEADLTNPRMVKWLFSAYQPEYVFLSAAKVGGIVANMTYPVEFMLDNMKIQMNVLGNAKEYGVKKLMFFGSACAYPKFAQNPLKPEYLLTGALEPSNECYALAKIAGIKLCQAYRKQYGCDFISTLPTNLYGIGDKYDLRNSHVLPGMLRRIHEAHTQNQPEISLWGTGEPVREFLFADDLASACLFLMDRYSGPEPANIGSGEWLKLSDLAVMLAKVVGYPGELSWNPEKPDGTPVRYLDSTVLKSLGWEAKVDLVSGIKLAYADFVERNRCGKLG